MEKLSSMIRIFEYAKFPDTCVIDRNRYEVAKRLSSKNFAVCAFGNRSSEVRPPDHINLIHPTNRIDTISQVFSFDPNIIHTRAWPRCLIMRYLIRLRNPKCKHILTLYSVPFTFLSTSEGLYKWGKFLAMDADVVRVVSKNTAQIVERQYNVDSIVIHDGIDTRVFEPRKHCNERLQILFIGRYVEFKHPHYVVKLAKYFPRCDFVLYGSGDLRNSLVAGASKLKNVEVNSPVPHERLPSIYANSDIFLFPSVIEGWSTVVLEALACGLPVVCFNTSSLPELVQHGKSGLLANNFREMREHLEYLTENEEARREFSRNARSRALEFDWDLIAQKWAKLFEQVGRA